MTLVSLALSIVPGFDTELEGLSNRHYRWWVCARKEPTVVPYGTEQLCSPQLYSAGARETVICSTETRGG